MLGYEEFRETLINKFVSYLPEGFEGYHVETQRVPRTNTCLESISIRPDEIGNENITPVMYIENLYDEYLKGDDDALAYIKDKAIMYAGYYDKGREMAANAKDGVDKIISKDSVFPQVINAERNREYLKDKPHREILDLAVVYRIDAPAFSGTVAVNNGVAEKLGLTEEQLYEVAVKNLEERFAPKLMKMSELLGIPEMFEEDVQLYVVTNKEKLMGANAILLPSVFEEYSEKAGGDFYVIPSSIHELLFVEGEVGKAEEIQEIMAQVNAMDCVGNDFLSDNLYRYNSETKQIEFALPDKVKNKEKDISVIEEKKPEKDAKVI